MFKVISMIILKNAQLCMFQLINLPINWSLTDLLQTICIKRIVFSKFAIHSQKTCFAHSGAVGRVHLSRTSFNLPNELPL